MEQLDDPELARSFTRVRVRSSEVDSRGIVNEARYIGYFELARQEWLRRRGFDYTDWMHRGFHLAIAELQFAYRGVAVADEILSIETRLDEIRAAALRFAHRATRGDTLLVEGSILLACVGRNLSVQRLAQEDVAVLKRGEVANGSEARELL